MSDSKRYSSTLAMADGDVQRNRMRCTVSQAATESLLHLGRSELRRSAAWLAIILTSAAIVLLAVLHIVSPQFAPSWRVISEYALGRHAWVLSLMFLCMGSSSWALSAAIWPQTHSAGGRIGIGFLLIAGFGGAMASYFDITHEVGHSIAGFLGVFGFPVAAMFLSVALGHNEYWRPARFRLLLLANLSWFSVVLLLATLAIMTLQMLQRTGGHLPQHAPEMLPPGVFALIGWADRLTVLVNCTWVLIAGQHAIELGRENTESPQPETRMEPGDVRKVANPDYQLSN